MLGFWNHASRVFSDVRKLAVTRCDEAKAEWEFADQPLIDQRPLWLSPEQLAPLPA